MAHEVNELIRRMLEQMQKINGDEKCCVMDPGECPNHSLMKEATEALKKMSAIQQISDKGWREMRVDLIESREVIKTLADALDRIMVASKAGAPDTKTMQLISCETIARHTLTKLNLR